ncbi:hypothetical protein JXJ21_15320 [candidate division KSB1 bacterium]|nr:hypothetical protein [candidate division KSB1 bacterium]
MPDSKILKAGPIQSTVDLRTMIRGHIIEGTCALLEQGKTRRCQAFESGDWRSWRDHLRKKVTEPMGEMLFGEDGPPLNVRLISKQVLPQCDIENVLFESLPGWDVNASVFLPKKDTCPPPWHAIVVPVGHSSKTRENYQIPAQVFAKLGYVAIIFDPPGMAGEKQGGNDHFDDGVRCYLTGQTSNRYFVIDALRCIDYLASRPDIDLSNGVGMTGVSGGGTTTMHAALIDERIRAAGPACCAAPSALHPVRDCYAPCTEALAPKRFANGIDNVDLLIAALPTPLLFICGEKDEVFKIEWSRQIADDVRFAYQKAGFGEHFRFYADPSGHAYTVEMALHFTRWMDRWISNQPGRVLSELSKNDFEMLPPEHLYCYPNLEGNIFTMNKALAESLRGKRNPQNLRNAAIELVNLKLPVNAPRAKAGAPTQIWVHHLQELLLQPEPGIELPATFMYPIEQAEKRGAVLFFDERGRWTALRKNGLLAEAVNFIKRDHVRGSVLTVDLRGWGDTKPADMP